MTDNNTQNRQQRLPRKLSEVIDNEELFPDTDQLADYANQELLFLGFEFKGSKKYPHLCSITARLPDDDVILHLRTTSQFVHRQLHELEDVGGFPVLATLKREGQAWMLK